MLDIGSLRSSFSLLFEVLFFWQLKLWSWWTRKSPKQILIRNLEEANYFEEWEAAAFQLDELRGNDLWRQNPTSKYYDYRLIWERLQGIIEAREDEDILGLVNVLRSGLVRNLGNITAPQLFSRAYAGTKLLIEDYITQVALAIDYVVAHPTSSGDSGGLTSQAKLDLLHDTRLAFGRSALVLQGGAIFGLCHIGVVKALHLRGLLPRIVVGTTTGALIAALVGVHTEDELLDFLAGDGIDLSAFAARAKNQSEPSSANNEDSGWFATLLRRVKRFVREGYFLDVKVLEECVRANVGDLTFEEAYNRTKRVLNITIPTAGAGSGVPNVLNYLTAPNVLIWSAAVASNATPGPLYSPVAILCKDPTGSIYTWSSAPSTRETSPARHFAPRSLRPLKLAAQGPSASETRDDSALARIRELFNVNHFLVSQARPYIAPFLQAGDFLSHAHLPRHSLTSSRTRGLLPLLLLRLLALELQHRLRQLDSLGLLHSSIRRFLIDEAVPGASLTLVPELTASDFVNLLERPTKRIVDEWILRGERSVWPAVGALKIRCAVEVELDRGYQVVRRRKPMDAVESAVVSGQGGEGLRLRGEGEKRKRARASSAGNP